MTHKEAVATNEAMAALLGHINARLALRVRSCRPGLGRCASWRYCAFCGRIHESQVIRDYRVRLLRTKSPTHLTLTMWPLKSLSHKNLRDLADMFGRLKRHKGFAEAIKGGVVNLQVEFNGQVWLVHLHAVVDYAGGLSENWIREHWMSLDGGRQVKNQQIAPMTQHQVLAYGARRPDLPHDIRRLREFYHATKGFMMIRSWGNYSPLYGRPPQRRARRAAAA